MSKPSKEALLAEFKDRVATAKEHRFADRMEMARAEYTQALAFAEEHFGPDSTQVDTVCLDLALFYSEMKEPGPELAMLERRVRIRKAEAGIPQIVDALQDLAECHNQQDHPNVAEKTYREAVDLCDETIEAHLPALRMALLYFGIFLNYRERYDDAVPVFERGLAVCKLDKDPPTFTAARTAMHLGEALLQVKRHEEARELIDAAAPVVTHRGQSPSTVFGKIFYYLGNYHQREDRFAEAERAYDLAILQTHNARNVSFRNLAYIQQAAASNDLKLHKPVSAENRLKQSVRLLLRSQQEEHHPDVLSVKQDLVNIYIPAKQYAKAEPILEEMVAASEHPEFSDERAKERYLNNLGFVQVHLEEFPKAEANLRRALLSAGEDHGCYVIKNLGLMYQKMGYSAEAIREYRKALPLFEEHFSKDHPVAEFIRGALAELENQTS
jgi:tetratricopeptide (TPR) repeat protein